MKKFHLRSLTKAMLLTAGAAVLVSGGIMLNGCKKDTPTQTTQSPEVDPSEAMVAHILEFRDRMAYYRENPNLKTGGQLYTAPEAVLELENITGGPLFQPVYFIQHNYRMFAGNRHLAMNIGIDDILAY